MFKPVDEQNQVSKGVDTSLTKQKTRLNLKNSFRPPEKNSLRRN